MKSFYVQIQCYMVSFFWLLSEHNILCHAFLLLPSVKRYVDQPQNTSVICKTLSLAKSLNVPFL